MALERKVFVVVNPNSANASTGRNWERIKAEIRQTIGPFEWAHTKAQGDATALTREAIANGHDLVVSIGGDGTNNEVVNGFFDGERQLNPDCAFSFVCRGTGGDFRKTFGWGLELSEALARIESGKVRPVDVGRFSYIDHTDSNAQKYFLNITSFGIGGLVDHLVNTSSKMLGGKLSFMIATAKALLKYRNQSVRLRFDGGEFQEHLINNVAIANGRFFGGGMMIAPEAEPDDGLFDVVILGDMSRTEVVGGSSHIYKGTHLSLPKVTHLRAATIEAEAVQADERVLIDMDGEQPGRLPCRFQILPGVLPLCTE